MNPTAGGNVMAQLGASVERAAGLILLVLGIRLPVEGTVGVLAMLTGDLGEDCFRIGPAPFVDGARSIRIKLPELALTAVRRAGWSRGAVDSTRRDASRKALFR